jgi:hypothetical protein
MQRIGSESGLLAGLSVFLAWISVGSACMTHAIDDMLNVPANIMIGYVSVFLLTELIHAT